MSRVRQETRHWDEASGRTGTLRVKEDADDYRYFPEPDLVPLDPSADDIARIDSSLPPLPADRRASLAAVAGREPVDDAVVIAVHRDLDGLASAAIAAGADADRVLTHVEHNLAVEGAASLSAEHLAALVRMETGGELTATQAKTVLAEVVATGTDPATIAKEKGFEALDSGALEGIVDDVIAAHPKEWEDFRTGDDKARGKLTGFFMGKVMQASKGQADGKTATALLRSKAGQLGRDDHRADVSSTPLMATFVFIHGAGGRGSYWDLVAAEVRGAGHDTVAMDLPCDDDAAGWSEYADAVVEAIGDRRGDLVVVAQSLGGFTAPLVAERVPVELIVLVTAMVPRPGETGDEWWANTGTAEAIAAQGLPEDAELLRP